MAGILRVKGEDGLWHGIPAIVGPAGPAGAKGETGNDGYSPTISVRQDVGKVVISFTDVDGRKNVTLYDGKTPEKGTDYWTAEDKAGIVSDVLSALPNASGVSF